jgi:hypothetical protein
MSDPESQKPEDVPDEDQGDTEPLILDEMAIAETHPESGREPDERIEPPEAAVDDDSEWLESDGVTDAGDDEPAPSDLGSEDWDGAAWAGEEDTGGEESSSGLPPGGDEAARRMEAADEEEARTAEDEDVEDEEEELEEEEPEEEEPEEEEIEEEELEEGDSGTAGLAEEEDAEAASAQPTALEDDSGITYIEADDREPEIVDVPVGGFSADVAVERFDALDRACLGFAVARGQPGDWAVDMGCGMGLQGLRFALVGMNALLIDMRDLGDRVDMLRDAVPAPNLHVLRKDLRNLGPTDMPRPLRLVYSQRALHFLSYEEALRLAAMIAVALEPGGRLYLSVAGLASPMGRNYGGEELPVEDRFGLLAPAQAQTFDIHEPVCLYAAEDVRALGLDAGLSDVRIWPSEQGNVKAIFEKR